MATKKITKKIVNPPSEESSSMAPYDREVSNNEYVFKETIRMLRPDIYVLMDILDRTHFNPLVVFQAIRHANNIAMGSKYGTVTIHIEDGVVTFVRGEESTKLNESLLLQKYPVA